MSKACSESAPSVWHLRLSYHGGGYSGWQIQPRGRTVQAELRERLRKLFHDESLEIQATSRTDAGVHALDQNISFVEPVSERPKKTPDRLRFLLNRWLPPEIRVTQAGMQPANFHARYSALAKAYTYVIENADSPSPFSAAFAWQFSARPDLSRMRAAANLLVGEHDFAGFSANPRRELESTVRTIHRFEVLAEGARIYLNVIGNGFLYKMVRGMAGYLAEAGLDTEWSPAECRAILAAGKRTAKVKTAPPHGLFLARVFFAPGEWLEYRPLLPPFAL